MEDETYFNEKQSIRESAKSLKKYGSISCNHMKKTINEVLIRHEIDKNETLQGIALKYGCSTEQIRRVNRLLITDSIFLRQYLMIPVEPDSPYYPKDVQQQSVRPHSMPPPQRAASIAGYPNFNNMHSDNNNSKSMNSVLTPPPPSSDGMISPEEENRKNMEDFLGKIDSSIANSKKYIAESQKNSEFMSTSFSDDNIFSSGGCSSSTSGYYSGSCSNKQRAYSTASSSSSSTSSYQQYFNNSNSNNNNNYHQFHHQHKRHGSSSDTTQLIVMTQGRKVQSSIQKLEKQQDEFFEL
uniref:Putative cell wall macromolecule catabolic process n=1 Tax=Corethrella appendiculata TaxID=1370023 RepID=U5ERF8_9DIPT